MNKAKVILVLVGSVLVEIAQEIITPTSQKRTSEHHRQASGLPLIFVFCKGVLK